MDKVFTIIKHKLLHKIELEKEKMLSNKVALVTGASKGIGRAVALALAKEGATVIVNYCSSQKEATEVVDAIIMNNGCAESYQCNVSNFDEVGVMINDIVNKYGKIDILVNNAGMVKDSLIYRMTEKDFDLVLETNLKGTFNTTRHASKFMMKQKYGKILNVASIIGLLGNAGQANYSASKAGIIGLTKSVSKELAGRGINVNAVAPGFIATDMTEEIPEKAKKEIMSKIPLHRYGQASEVADLITYLVSDKAEYITGQIICIDGGITI